MELHTRKIGQAQRRSQCMNQWLRWCRCVTQVPSATSHEVLGIVLHLKAVIPGSAIQIWTFIPCVCRRRGESNRTGFTTLPTTQPDSSVPHIRVRTEARLYPSPMTGWWRILCPHQVQRHAETQRPMRQYIANASSA